MSRLLLLCFLLLNVSYTEAQNVACLVENNTMLIGEKNSLTIEHNGLLREDDLKELTLIPAEVMSAKAEKDRVQIEILAREWREKTLVLHFTSWDSGTIVIPPFSIDKNNLTYTQAVMFKVDFPVTDESGEIQDIIEVQVFVNPPKKTFEERFWWLMFILQTGLFVAGLWLILKERKIETLIAETPLSIDERALRDLDELEQQQLFIEGRQKEHFYLFSTILRRYIAARFKVETFEKTSQELLASLRKHPVARPHLSLLEKLLNLADIIKYSKANTQEQEIRLTLDEARDFVKKSTEQMAYFEAEKGDDDE